MTESAGAVLFANFLERNEISIRDAGTALDVSHVTILAWRERRSRPLDVHKEAIARWTSGEVPFDSWLTKDEKRARRQLEKVGPFSGKSGKAA